MEDKNLEYAGFWVRGLATLIDNVLVLLVTWPVLIAIYGWGYLENERIVMGPAHFIISWIFPTVATISFWLYRQATPGKMATALKIVDARTGREPSAGQLVGRYFAYFLSLLPLGLGFLWAAFDPKKQGWHDKLAGTVVVRGARRGPEPVRFQ